MQAAVSDIQAESTEHVGIQERPQPRSTDYERFYCGVPSCRHELPTRAQLILHQKEVHQFTVDDENEQLQSNEDQIASTGRAGAEEDCIFNYASALMKMALLKRNFDDAIREMDGPRIFLCWKYMMLYFRESRKHKYALEGL